MTEKLAMPATETAAPVVEARDRRGKLLFEYDPTTERSILHLPGGVRLEVAEDGQVELSSPRGIRIRSEGEIEIAGDRSVRVRAPGVEVLSEQARLEGRTVEVQAEEMKVRCGRLERTVGRLFDFARAAYVRVEELMHTRAGRIRTEATGTFHVQSSETILQSEKDVRIQGESINLG